MHEHYVASIALWETVFPSTIAYVNVLGHLVISMHTENMHSVQSVHTLHFSSSKTSMVVCYPTQSD